MYKTKDYQVFLSKTALSLQHNPMPNIQYLDTIYSVSEQLLLFKIKKNGGKMTRCNWMISLFFISLLVFFFYLLI